MLLFPRTKPNAQGGVYTWIRIVRRAHVLGDPTRPPRAPSTPSSPSTNAVRLYPRGPAAGAEASTPPPERAPGLGKRGGRRPGREGLHIPAAKVGSRAAGHLPTSLMRTFRLNRQGSLPSPAGSSSEVSAYLLPFVSSGGFNS